MTSLKNFFLISQTHRRFVEGTLSRQSSIRRVSPCPPWFAASWRTCLVKITWKMQIRTAKRYTCICGIYVKEEEGARATKEHRLKVEDGVSSSFQSELATTLVSRFGESLCAAKLVEFTGLSTINKAGSGRCAGNCRASISSCKRSKIHVVRSKERWYTMPRRLPPRNGRAIA